MRNLKRELWLQTISNDISSLINAFYPCIIYCTLWVIDITIIFIWQNFNLTVDTCFKIYTIFSGRLRHWWIPRFASSHWFSGCPCFSITLCCPWLSSNSWFAFTPDRPEYSRSLCFSCSLSIPWYPSNLWYFCTPGSPWISHSTCLSCTLASPLFSGSPLCLDGHWFSCTLCTIGSLTALGPRAFLTASNTPATINSPPHLVALGYPAALLAPALPADLDSPAGLSTDQCTVASACLARTASLTPHAHPGNPAMFVSFSSMAASVAFSSQGAVATQHSPQFLNMYLQEHQ